MSALMGSLQLFPGNAVTIHWAAVKTGITALAQLSYSYTETHAEQKGALMQGLRGWTGFLPCLCSWAASSHFPAMQPQLTMQQ